MMYPVAPAREVACEQRVDRHRLARPRAAGDQADVGAVARVEQIDAVQRVARGRVPERHPTPAGHARRQQRQAVADVAMREPPRRAEPIDPERERREPRVLDQEPARVQARVGVGLKVLGEHVEQLGELLLAAGRAADREVDGDVVDPAGAREPQLGVELGGLALLLVVLLGRSACRRAHGGADRPTAACDATAARGAGAHDPSPSRARRAATAAGPPSAPSATTGSCPPAPPTDASPPPARRWRASSQSRPTRNSTPAPTASNSAWRCASATPVSVVSSTCGSPASASASSGAAGADGARERGERVRAVKRHDVAAGGGELAGDHLAQAQRVGGRALVRAPLERPHPRPPRAPASQPVHDVAGARHAVMTVNRSRTACSASALRRTVCSSP